MQDSWEARAVSLMDRILQATGGTVPVFIGSETEDARILERGEVPLLPPHKVVEVPCDLLERGVQLHDFLHTVNFNPEGVRAQ